MPLSGEQAIGVALRAFSLALSEGRPRLAGIIITASGSPIESPLAIVTPWDLLGITAAGT